MSHENEEKKSTESPEKKEEVKKEIKKEEVKLEIKPLEKNEDEKDPTFARLLSAQKEIDDLKKALHGEREKIKTFEKEDRKGKLLMAFADAYPGYPREELRGIALVAQEDGKIDMYSADTAKQIEVLKEIVKAKKQPVVQPKLGGTPGAPAKPETNKRKFLI